MQLLKKNQAEPTLEIHKEIESRLFRSASMKKKKKASALLLAGRCLSNSLLKF
jgi:hypothetical protein